MIIVIAFGVDYSCEKAVKGPDYIRLYDAVGNNIVSFEGVSDFAPYIISGGDWAAPEPTIDDYLLDLDFRLSMVELGL